MASHLGAMASGREQNMNEIVCLHQFLVGRRPGTQQITTLFVNYVYISPLKSIIAPTFINMSLGRRNSFIEFAIFDHSSNKSELARKAQRRAFLDIFVCEGLVDKRIKSIIKNKGDASPFHNVGIAKLHMANLNKSVHV